jgi:hypothetical protein
MGTAIAGSALGELVHNVVALVESYLCHYVMTTRDRNRLSVSAKAYLYYSNYVVPNFHLVCLPLFNMFQLFTANESQALAAHHNRY